VPNLLGELWGEKKNHRWTLGKVKSIDQGSRLISAFPCDKGYRSGGKEATNDPWNNTTKAADTF